MDRKNFLKKLTMGSVAAGAGITATEGASRSTYDKLREQVGFNHLPLEEENGAKSVLHKADSRGHANHGWLDTHHSFSFARYYNPERMHFGVLRVLNDDRVTAGRGFRTHPHDNMEIISIPLEGDLEHKDSMGNVAVIKEGDVQVMSAGTGIRHSEFNKNGDKDVKFLQIWLFPREKGVVPRYDQISIRDVAVRNEFYQVLSPNPNDQGVWIHQDAWFHIGEIEAGQSAEYTLKQPGNGIYAFVIEGAGAMQGQPLEKRDGYGVWDTDKIAFEATSDSKVLLMEVPMTM